MAQKKSNINIFLIFSHNKIIHVEQRAEGGAQINRNVGATATQGGQNAIFGRTANKYSQFANGNGRSGIAGKKNDEQGGQESKKVKKTIIKGASKPWIKRKR
ncbi:hypothetical protein [Paenibacillus protaetiae]|uniref:Uncharacterized protein n=1 Tax=Paenibacillus protaetiae TaxID=2509456 RepID=A0A4P6F321_9BACL|nr:hypothetical protein [Paenibacillus protaetiae]QAY67507.1 hypothetical protein ET464_15045 [Paenibacillus protaetiae]